MKPSCVDPAGYQICLEAHEKAVAKGTGIVTGTQYRRQADYIDTINWVMGENPVSAFGSGGRFTRPEDSEMWDNVVVDYEYPGGKKLV